jgi:hypothetical protein
LTSIKEADCDPVVGIMSRVPKEGAVFSMANFNTELTKANTRSAYRRHARYRKH